MGDGRLRMVGGSRPGVAREVPRPGMGDGVSRRGLVRRLVAGLGLLGMGGGWGRGAWAAAARAEPNALMATFILSFVEFTTWPEGALGTAAEPFGVGLVGRDPFGTKLDEVFQGESIGGRSFVIRRFKAGEVPTDCEVVFVGDQEEEHVKRLLAGLEANPVLTLSARPGFCAMGGMVTFRVERGKVVFEINREAVSRARLTLNSRLLNVAKLYREPGAR